MFSAKEMMSPVPALGSGEIADRYVVADCSTQKNPTKPAEDKSSVTTDALVVGGLISDGMEGAIMGGIAGSLLD